MNSIVYDSDNGKFIQQAVQFCNAISKYTDVLDINASEVESLKRDMNIAAYVILRYPSFTPSYIHYNITSLRGRVAILHNMCIKSPKYCHQIGVELGFEAKEENEKNLYSEYMGLLTLWRHESG